MTSRPHVSHGRADAEERNDYRVHHTASPSNESQAANYQNDWKYLLQNNPLFRTQLEALGVSASSLLSYADQVSSKPVSQKQLEGFFDPPTPPLTQLQTALSSSQPLSSHSTTFAHSRGPPSLDACAREGWNTSVGVDWRELNGSRDVPLLLSDNMPSTFVSARTLDKRTGHRLDYKLPQKQRFVEDAYYARIVQLRKSECNIPPDRRLPQARFSHCMVHEGTPQSDKQQKAVDDAERRKQARKNNIVHNSAPHFSVTSQPALESPGMKLLQHKIRSKGCSAALQSTHRRMILGQEFAPGEGPQFKDSALLVGGKPPRRQKLRDELCGGRPYDIISNVLISVLPPTAEAVNRRELSQPHAQARANRALFQQQEQQQDQ